MLCYNQHFLSTLCRKRTEGGRAGKSVKHAYTSEWPAGNAMRERVFRRYTCTTHTHPPHTRGHKNKNLCSAVLAHVHFFILNFLNAWQITSQNQLHVDPVIKLPCLAHPTHAHALHTCMH